MVTKRQSVDPKPNAASAATTTGKKRPPQAVAQAKPGTFQLPPGLYAIRALPHPQHPAVNPVILSQVPSGNARVDFLPAAGVQDLTLAQSHDCIAVRVMHDTATMIATKVDQGEEISMRIGIERIDIAKADPLTEQVGPNGSPMLGAASTAILSTDTTVRMLGHVERIGDTVVHDQWLGNPRSNARLEGFAIKVKGLPDTVQLVYGCHFMNPTLKSQFTSTGQFVGTRQKAQPIRSVVFDLEGPGADQYQLVGQVAFSGAYSKPELIPIVQAQELHGSRQVAHLVAIDLQVVVKSDVVPSAIAPMPVTGMESEDDEQIDLDQGNAFAEKAEPDQADQSDAVVSDADEQGGAWTDDEIAELFGR